MAFYRAAWRPIRCFHSTIRYLSEEDFNLTQLIKSNTQQKGFNDVKAKSDKPVKTSKSKSALKTTAKKESLSTNEADNDSVNNIAQEKKSSKAKSKTVSNVLLEETNVDVTNDLPKVGAKAKTKGNTDKTSSKAKTKALKNVQPEETDVDVTSNDLTKTRANVKTKSLKAKTKTATNVQEEEPNVTKIGVKTKSSKAKTKTATNVQEEEPNVTKIGVQAQTSGISSQKLQRDINGDLYKVYIPEWMNVVLECPPISIGNVDSRQFSEFKNFIEELEIKNLPGVTTVIKKTEPESQAKVLRNWSKRKTKELGGEKQFEEFRQKLFTRGSSLHDCIERYLMGERDLVLEPHVEGPWESIQHVLADISHVKKTEKVIVHPNLFYKGQLDCLAAYRDQISIVEWKVSSKPKIMLSQTYDNPLQVAAYLGAVNRSGILNRMNVPTITTGVLVIAYEDGEPAHVHEMSERICNKYWGKWTERLYHYWALQYQKMMTSTT